MPVNEKWHKAHPMPRNPSDAERIAWHLDHRDRCGCRPVPTKLLQKIRMRDAVDDGRPRCAWATSDPLYVRYHDEEWGKPSHDDRHLFEMIILEGAQAGLSWITILRKRENYRTAFDRFDAKKIARYDARKVKQLLGDEGIVRNRLKIASTIDNAKAFLEVQKELGSFDRFVWSFVGGKPLVNRRRAMKDIPPRTAESDAMSKALAKRGFRFVGSTICYAFMQACGLVNDHVQSCYLAPRR
jgi:DNA-3-methyladenine glycosylase I